MATPTDTLADLGRLIANYSDAQDVVTAANERGKEPSNDEYWNRDDAGVAVADQLSLMLELGWTLVPPAPTAVSHDPATTTERPRPFCRRCAQDITLLDGHVWSSKEDGANCHG